MLTPEAKLVIAVEHALALLDQIHAEMEAYADDTTGEWAEEADIYNRIGVIIAILKGDYTP